MRWSSQFARWLADQNLSLAATTYQAHRLFLIGLNSQDELLVTDRYFDRPMGMLASSEEIHLATRHALLHFKNGLIGKEPRSDFDAIYKLHATHPTNDLDIHDIGLNAAQEPLFVNTRFSSLDVLSDGDAPRDLWHPDFVTALKPEDRCHLNGMAMENGQPRFATSVSQSDSVAGWRGRRHEGGCLIDVVRDETVVGNLSMPHSPRLYRERIWLLNSGAGELGYVDSATGRFEPIVFCPGYLRGLTFHNEFAIVGVSQPRHNRTFSDLQLGKKLAEYGMNPMCGILVIDLEKPAIVHWFQFEGFVAELYDVQPLVGVRRATITPTDGAAQHDHYIYGLPKRS